MFPFREYNYLKRIKMENSERGKRLRRINIGNTVLLHRLHITTVTNGTFN